MLKIPLRINHETLTFSEHCIRFGCVKGFYISIVTKDTDNTDNSTSENLFKNLVNVSEKLDEK